MAEKILDIMERNIPEERSLLYGTSSSSFQQPPGKVLALCPLRDDYSAQPQALGIYQMVRNAEGNSARTFHCVYRQLIQHIAAIVKEGTCLVLTGTEYCTHISPSRS